MGFPKNLTTTKCPHCGERAFNAVQFRNTDGGIEPVLAEVSLIERSDAVRHAVNLWWRKFMYMKRCSKCGYVGFFMADNVEKIGTL